MNKLIYFFHKNKIFRTFYGVPHKKVGAFSLKGIQQFTCIPIFLLSTIQLTFPDGMKRTIKQTNIL